MLVDDLGHPDHIAGTVLDGHTEQRFRTVAGLYIDFPVKTFVLVWHGYEMRYI